MASILGTHLSIYPEFQTYLFNREFIAYQMGLLEPSSSEYIQAWGANSQNGAESVMAGENLVFMQKIMGNTDIIIQMTSLMLNNLCHQQELAKILGSLPIKYGVKPLAKIFLIDKTKVSKLIQCLCLDSDFQSKMVSFIPVDFKAAQKEIEEAESYAKGSKRASSFLYKRYESPTEKKEKKDKKKEEEEKNPFEEMRELIHDAKSMSVQKGRDYHERITKILFLNSDPDDLVWRRVIKVSMLHLKDESSSSILWMGKLLKPLRFKINEQFVTFDDIQQINFDWEKKEDFYYKIDDLEDEIMPEDSMSGIMKKNKSYPNKQALPRLINASSSMSLLNLGDNNSMMQKSYDYEIDDPGLSAVNLQLQDPADPDDSILANPNREDPRRGIKGQVDNELAAVTRQNQ